jgi:hypothetical protein
VGDKQKGELEMSFIKIRSHSGNSLIVEVYQWKDAKYGHVCVGKFEVQAVEDCLNISAIQDWRTHHRNDVELSHYSNEPEFHLEKIGVFASFKVKELVGEKETRK